MRDIESALLANPCSTDHRFAVAKSRIAAGVGLKNCREERCEEYCKISHDATATCSEVSDAQSSGARRGGACQAFTLALEFAADC